MPEKWTYTLKFGFTLQIAPLISASPLFNIEVTRQLTIGEKAQIEGLGFTIESEEQTE